MVRVKRLIFTEENVPFTFRNSAAACFSTINEKTTPASVSSIAVLITIIKIQLIMRDTRGRLEKVSPST